jgi:hypothetical protein
MSPGLRKVALAVHLAVSVGWVGALAAYIALDVSVALSVDEQQLRAAYLAMDPIASYVIVPLAVVSVISGIIVALGTSWGLFRHYWVLISLILTLIAMVVLLVEARRIGSLTSVAAKATTSESELRALPSTLVHSVGGMVVLLVVLGLNVFKPRGLTRYGWRKLQGQRWSQRAGESTLSD